MALIAVLAVLISPSLVDTSVSVFDGVPAIVDLDQEHSQEGHAHGCSTCHFHANLEGPRANVAPTTLAAPFMSLILEIAPQAHVGPPLRPPSA